MSWVVSSRSAWTFSAVAAVGERVVERGDRQQFVDRRRFGRALGEAVAGGQRAQLERGDAIDEPIEMLANPRVGPRARRRLEQHVEGGVELGLGAGQVAERQLLAALFEMRVGRGEQRLHRIDRRGRGRRRPVRSAAAGVRRLRRDACTACPTRTRHETAGGYGRRTSERPARLACSREGTRSVTCVQSSRSTD